MQEHYKLNLIFAVLIKTDLNFEFVLIWKKRGNAT